MLLALLFVTGTALVGDITSQSDIRIDGKITGNLTCSAKLIIGPTGEVEGTVDCKSAVVEGTFDGVLHVNELLSIADTARVTGEVRYNKLCSTHDRYIQHTPYNSM